MSNPLHQGKPVAITISDPWEFGTACGTGPFHGQVSDVSDGRVLIVFDKPIPYGSDLLTAAICKSRYAKSLESIQDAPLAVNVTLLITMAKELISVTNEEFRGGYAAIGSLYTA